MPREANVLTDTQDSDAHPACRCGGMPPVEIMAGQSVHVRTLHVNLRWRPGKDGSGYVAVIIQTGKGYADIRHVSRWVVDQIGTKRQALE